MQGGQSAAQAVNLKALGGFFERNHQSVLEILAWVILLSFVIFGFAAGGYIGGYWTFSKELGDLMKNPNIMELIGMEKLNFPKFSFNILGALFGMIAGGAAGLTFLTFTYGTINMWKNIENINLNQNKLLSAEKTIN
jgi:hypothetical protein